MGTGECSVLGKKIGFCVEGIGFLFLFCGFWVHRTYVVMQVMKLWVGACSYQDGLFLLMFCFCCSSSSRGYVQCVE